MNTIQSKEYEKLKKLLGQNNYRIGLDLGVGSIGYAIVILGDNGIPTKPILIGSRIFTASTGAQDRRVFRQQRNSHRHHRERMRYLWKLLAENKLSLPLPNDLDKKENSIQFDTSRKRFPIEVLREDPYTLRFKALNEKLSLLQSGYALYHIANHRGTASVRSFAEDDESKIKENSETAKLAKSVRQIMKERQYRTFGEYLYKERIENNDLTHRLKVTNRKTSQSQNKEFAVTRDIINEEAQKILSVQKQYYPEILKDEYIDKIIKTIDYETEKLIPESGLCPYFKNEKRLPRSHKLNEYRRMYEALNNAKYFTPILDETTGEISSYEEKEFTKEQKEKLFNEVLLKEKELTEAKTKKLLNLPDGSEIILQGRDKKTQKIKGYGLITLESMPFWERLTEEKQDRFFYDWNSCPDEKTLKNKLLKDYLLSQEEIETAFENIVLSSSYGPIGKTATKIVLEYIKTGLSYTEAIEKAIDNGQFSIDKQQTEDKLPYYGKILSDSAQKLVGKSFSPQFKNRNYAKPNYNKDEEKYGKIANPVVHQTLNELKKLVNEIIEIFGKKPSEIGIETARELKKSLEERERIAKQQSANENNKNKIYETYIKPHLEQIQSRNESFSNYILKFELLEEQNFICPFCLKEINPDDIINSMVDIEHLFPIEESEDNTRNNLVIAHNDCNADKAKRAPYNAFSAETSGKYIWNDILHNAKEKLPQKAWRFNQNSFEKFLENKPMEKRFSTDNSYISKISMHYLSCLFDKKTAVLPIKSSLTAQLRIAWGLNGLMIPFAKTLVSGKELEFFQKDVSKNKKIRLDNRHHALDALVVAFANRGYQKFLSNVNTEGYKINYRDKSWLSKILLPPANQDITKFQNLVRVSIANANVSIKHDHNINGELVKNTAYKIYYSNDKQYTITTYKSVNDIRFKQNETPEETLLRTLCKFENNEIKDIELKSKIASNKKIYDKIKNRLLDAKIELQKANEKSKNEGKKPTDISEIRIYQKACSIVGGKYIQFGNRISDKFFTLKKPTETTTGFGYDTGDNLCLDLYHDNQGKLCGEIIRKIEFNQNQIPDYKKDGYALLERIYQGDILEVDMCNDKSSLMNKTGSSPESRTFVKVLTFTESDSYFENKKDQIQIYFGNILKSKYSQDDSFYISSMQKYNVRKVILTSLGIIKYRSQILRTIEE
ncbi:MAG: type II CRISPR RNA-guided endonuclease Cas9 [Elusimicrobiota bacterium]|jgi:CRISPR-associated endonuclease Csn1|nr:type II CRISPR RNA-guided endonuclease Cas9 [Elusimicrobiota bacterium]